MSNYKEKTGKTPRKLKESAAPSKTPLKSIRSSVDEVEPLKPIDPNENSSAKQSKYELPMLVKRNSLETVGSREKSADGVSNTD